MENLNVLLADDDESLARVIQIQLKASDVTSQVVHNGLDCLKALEKRHFDALILDLNMPMMGGLDVLKKLSANLPCPVIILTAYEDLGLAIKSVKLGAFDFLTKPFEKDKLLNTLENAIRQWKLNLENESLKRKLFEKEHLDYVPIKNPILKKIIESSARSDEVILIQGETGTGKEYLAKYIHAISKRNEAPFLAVNCATIPEPLLESSLFGHTKGAFTGATEDQTGLLSQVSQGTLFLDEIGDMPLNVQSKLLRVLEDGSYRRLGDSKEFKFKGRILSATNQDLEEMSNSNKFRADLFYRLNTIPILLPPLRQRLDELDIYIKKFVPEKRLHRAALEHLKNRRWSGNLRELRNYCARMRVFIEEEYISKKQLLHLESLLSKKETNSTFVLPTEGLNVEALIDDLLSQALNRCNHNQTKAGKLLGLTRQQVIHRMRKWGRQD